eukprot:CAMPEP_0179068316 /NCGR_PEP_ID=MMETSP0796-20121207/29940_1 /TAXON_ID=73915 /ORGANISM="Pyrodinium bahamense, Strain pbaha01" /LENGTH=700 /DNA_ID=CAMNT_0020765369 /DNA_START=27 /DNA_END=2130 /DNA_ORIENTATION=+
MADGWKEDEGEADDDEGGSSASCRGPTCCNSRAYLSLAASRGGRLSRHRGALKRCALAIGVPAAGLLLVSALVASMPRHRADGEDGRAEEVVNLLSTLAAARATATPGKCAGRGENCLISQCCKEPGMACYRKVGNWGMCKPDCVSGPDPVDASPSRWSCEQVGARTPGSVPSDYWGGLKPAAWVKTNCSGIGENCYRSGCCKDPGMACFAKDENWASCKPQCSPNMIDISDLKPQPWNCVALGGFTPGAAVAGYRAAQKAAPWVATKCAAAGGSCLESKCCRDPGMRCYQKNARWAGCRVTCEHGPNLFDVDDSFWNCTALGPRTPGMPPFSGEVQDWVASKCTHVGGNCIATKCCRRAGTQCFQKNPSWATCMSVCAPGVHSDDPQKSPWACKKLGPRTPMKRTYPSLFCWALSRSSGDEAALLRFQFGGRMSLFSCDEWAVYSDMAFDLGGGALATVIGDLTAKKGKWGSWLNTKVFVKAWHAIFWTGQFRDHDWTVKIDPDATFFPDRLKQHVAGIPTTEAWCVHNSLTSTPILGPLEALNRAAMFVYYANNHPDVSGTDKAVCENPYMGASGEDGFVSGCLQRLGVKGKYDHFILKNDGKACNDGTYAAYHPLKTVPQYKVCRDQALGPKAAPEAGLGAWVEPIDRGPRRMRSLVFQKNRQFLQPLLNLLKGNAGTGDNFSSKELDLAVPQYNAV